MVKFEWWQKRYGTFGAVQHESHSALLCISHYYLDQVCTLFLGFPGGSVVKESAYQSRNHRRHGFDPWMGKIPWKRNGNPL